MRIRLKVAAVIEGKLYPRDSIVVLPEGLRGPHRLVRKSQDTITYKDADAAHRPGEFDEEPLYEEIADERQ